MKKNKILKNEKGFTLVELIVVLVILAILAAILVPALLGYIDKARRKQDVLNAREYLEAGQALLSELYAMGEQPNKEHRGYIENNGCCAWYNKYRFEMLGAYIGKDLTKDHPYICMLRVGSYKEYASTDIHKAYTVYGIVYQETADSDLIFIENGKVYDTYPLTDYGKSVDGSMKIFTYAISYGNASRPQALYDSLKVSS